MLRAIELFSGVGTFSMALRDLGVSFKLMDSVEIDPYAVKAFNAIHETSYEPKDITKWDNFKDGTWEKGTRIDLVTGGFPCVDVSIAGKQAGIIKGKTRSGLMYEMLRVIDETRPTFVIAENVKNLLSKRHRPQLDEYVREMERMGYATDYKVLDAKDFGGPQHRERIFIVSYKCSSWERPFTVKSPDPIPLTKKLGDVLEKDVDEKYYLSEAQTKNLTYKETGNVEVILDIKGRDCIKRVYRKSGVAPTLTTMQGGNRQPKIIDDTYGYDEKPREYSDASPTLRAGRQGLKVEDKGRVRRLTPKECWRLMSYSDIDFDKAKKAGLSDARLYKLAGNGIVLDVAKALLKELFYV